MSSRREPLVSLAAGSSLLRYGNAAGGEEDLDWPSSSWLKKIE